MQGQRKQMPYTRVIAVTFLVVIAVGTILLSLPIAARDGRWTSLPDAAFTATSATCVTGLVVFDTYTHWSLFGQLVILAMIQIGGLGFMTFIAAFSMMMRRHIGLQERRLLMQSSGNLQYHGVLTLIRRIVCGTLLIEAAGAVLLSLRFCRQMGPARGIYAAVFHAVSAFCNAGFDVMGQYQPFGSLTAYAGDALVSLTLCALIIIGGIGFLVWEDVLRHGIHLRRYTLHSKIVLVTTGILVLSGWAAFFFLEKNHSMAGMSVGERVIAALFQSVTTRTAGFNTVDQASLSNAGSVLTIFYMLIGGSPGSTAGGMKTMTLAIVSISIFCMAKNRRDVTAFRRRLDEQQVRQALIIVGVYTVLVLCSVTAISIWEPQGLRAIAFEVVSAVATVGLSAAGTAQFTLLSRMILMILMYIGRLGGLSLVLMLAEKRAAVPLDRPTEKVLIG